MNTASTAAEIHTDELEALSGIILPDLRRLLSNPQGTKQNRAAPVKKSELACRGASRPPLATRRLGITGGWGKFGTWKIMLPYPKKILFVKLFWDDFGALRARRASKTISGGSQRRQRDTGGPAMPLGPPYTSRIHRFGAI